MTRLSWEEVCDLLRTEIARTGDTSGTIATALSLSQSIVSHALTGAPRRASYILRILAHLGCDVREVARMHADGTRDLWWEVEDRPAARRTPRHSSGTSSTPSQKSRKPH